MSGQSEQMFDKLNQNKTNLADQHLLTINLIAFPVLLFSCNVLHVNKATVFLS